MPVDQNEYCLGLVQSALHDLERGGSRLSSIIQKCIRIARLRNDFDNLWWLSYEVIDVTRQEQVEPVADEIRPHYSRQEFEELASRYEKALNLERALTTFRTSPRARSKVTHQYESVMLIEERIATFEADLGGAPQPHNQGLNRAMTVQMMTELKGILVRISQRVHTYLSTAEQQLIAGQLNADIFERNRTYVDAHLKKIAPDALEKFVSVYKRVSEGDDEARSQALASCRRILKAVADAVYPASDAEVIGSDGKSRVLNDDMYVARLWQFIFEKLGKNRSADLLKAQVDDLGHRVDAVYGLSNKGTHATVSDFELNQCAIQTYLLVGDVMRIADEGHEAAAAEALGAQ